ncbi:hypothetical protein Scep_011531 [Stephania cephalantha]|uniref:Uncharacterized protein n=1 Tax=Stephania cephalantha TaxID=152367 RepID=A0AAP0JFB8_9MAGN
MHQTTPARNLYYVREEMRGISSYMKNDSPQPLDCKAHPTYILGPYTLALNQDKGDAIA